MAIENPTWGEERIADELPLKLGRRRILHYDLTAHPTAEWTFEQFREALPGSHPYRFLIHDRDRIFSKELDEAVTTMGVRVLRTPVRAPKANSICERLVGTARRECLDIMIPLGERCLRRTLSEWVVYYNRGWPHSAFGPGIPESVRQPTPPAAERRRLPSGLVVRNKAVLGGLHHQYWLEKVAA